MRLRQFPRFPLAGVHLLACQLTEIAVAEHSRPVVSVENSQPQLPTQGELLDKLIAHERQAPKNFLITIEPRTEFPAEWFPKQTAAERRTPNQPWYSQYQGKKKRRRK